MPAGGLTPRLGILYSFAACGFSTPNRRDEPGGTLVDECTSYDDRQANDEEHDGESGEPVWQP